MVLNMATREPALVETLDGARVPILTAARLYGLSDGTIRSRMKAGDRGQALFRPAAAHGMAYSLEYVCYRGMVWRCSDRATGLSRKNYFLKGIRVCKRWLGPDGITNFRVDMGPRPSRRHSIERRNNALGYSPENCYWALPPAQNRNKGNNRRITFQGRTMCAKDWAREVGLSYHTLHKRLTCYGWGVERALTEPARVRREKDVKQEGGGDGKT